MLTKKGIIACLGVILGCCGYSTVYAIPGSSSITGNGKVATLTLPLKASITQDLVTRSPIEVMPLSAQYELIPWDKNAKKFHDHDFLVRVLKDNPTVLQFEIVNDQYTCSYAKPNWGPGPLPGRLPVLLPDDIAVVNVGYTYQLKVKLPKTGREFTTPVVRGAPSELDKKTDWLDNVDKTKKFIDVALHIQFPDVSQYSLLMDKGGICRGSVTMLISDKL